MVHTVGGTIMRSRPENLNERTPKQRQMGANLASVNRAWDALSAEQAAAWRAYAGTLATRNPQTAMVVAPKAYNVFVRLGTKFLQMNGGTLVPMTPPSGVFLGDIVRVSVVGLSGQIRFTADRANAAGMVTELLIQRLSGPNNAPKPDGYRSAGFVSFVAGSLSSNVAASPGAYSCAERFVEGSSGRMGESVVVGTVMVG